MMSSSLENVQHHCSKIAVLINGALRHVTSPYKLAEDFGLGTTFTYVVYLKPENEQNNSGSSFEQYTELKARIEKDIPKVVLQEELHVSKPQTMTMLHVFKIHIIEVNQSPFVS